MRHLPIVVAVIGSCFASAALAADEPRVFTEEKLYTFHLTIQKADFDAMKPTKQGVLSMILRGGNRTPTSRPTTQPAVERLPPNPFGLMHAYVRGSFEHDGKTIKDVAVRFKGNSSYAWGGSGGGGLHRPYKVDFDRFVNRQTFQGLTKLNFHNASFDPSQLRERLSYELFLAAGVPAPRTGLGVLYLTVPGRHDRKELGVYTLIEEVNKPFLRRHYKTDKGLLLKPEGAYNLAYRGEEWPSYTSTFEPLSGDTPENTERFVDFIRLIHKSDDAAFAEQVERHLDVEAFLRFVAVHALLSHMDSILTTGHNYYLYVHPDTGQVHFLPWDLNLSFGAFGWTGSPRELTSLSIDHPHANPNRLFDRVLAIPAYKKRYHAIVRELIDGPLSPNRVSKRVDELNVVLKQVEALPGRPATRSTTRPKQGDDGFHLPNHDGAFKSPDLKQFMADRVASVRLQLDGMQEGYIPSIRFKRILGMEKDD